MEREQLNKELIQDEEKIDQMIEDIKEELKQYEGLTSPTTVREVTPMHNNNFKKLINYLIENDNEVIEIPGTKRGRNIIHRENLERFYLENTEE